MDCYLVLELQRFFPMFSFIKSGDHVVFQSSLYGGTINMIFNEFKNLKLIIACWSLDPIEYQKAIKQSQNDICRNSQ